MRFFVFSMLDGNDGKAVERLRQSWDIGKSRKVEKK